MRKLVLLFVSVSLCFGLVAQTRSSANRSGINSDTSRFADIREKLVQLALQNPEFEIADRNVAIAQYQLKSAKGDWLSFVQPQININPTNIYPSVVDQMFFPIWNVAIALPLRSEEHTSEL